MTIEVPVRRSYGRTVEDMRPVSIAPNALPHAEGSAYIKIGDTHVICAATVEDRVPGWMKGTGRGWVTAEYGMLPRSTSTRTEREAARGQQKGRTVDVGRSAVADEPVRAHDADCDAGLDVGTRHPPEPDAEHDRVARLGAQERASRRVARFDPHDLEQRHGTFGEAEPRGMGAVAASIHVGVADFGGGPELPADLPAGGLPQGGLPPLPTGGFPGLPGNFPGLPGGLPRGLPGLPGSKKR